MRIMGIGARCAATGFLCLIVTGCQTPHGSRAMNTELRGSVVTAADLMDASIVVVALDHRDGRIAHRAFLAHAREYVLRLAWGRYKVYAFIDQDRDGALGTDEPRSMVYTLAASLRPGERRELPALAIAPR